MPDGVGMPSVEMTSSENVTVSTQGFAGPAVPKPPTARDKPYGTIVFSEGRNLTLIKGKTPSELATLITSARQSAVPFLCLVGTEELTGRVWVDPESITALIFWEAPS